MKKNSFAADLTLIQALEKRSQPVACAGRTLFRQGEACDGLYIVKSGEAALMLESAAGRAVMCLRAGGGSLLGLPGVVGNEPHTLTAMAQKDSDVRFVKRDDFEELMREEPSLYPIVLQMLAADVRTARQVLRET